MRKLWARILGRQRPDWDTPMEGGARPPASFRAPVVLLPTDTPISYRRRNRWSHPLALTLGALVLFAFGTGAGLLLSGPDGFSSLGLRSRAANSIQAGMPATLLPRDDLRIAPTARDSLAVEDTADEPSPPPSGQKNEPPPAQSQNLTPNTAAAVTPSRTPAPTERRTDPGAAQPIAPSPVPTPAREPVARAAAQEPVLDSVITMTAAPAEEIELRPSPADHSAIRLELLSGIARLVGLINEQNASGGLSSQVLDPKTMTDLSRFIKLEAPVASMGTVHEVALDGPRATGQFTLTFEWRGSFGVEKKEAVVFQAVVNQTNDGWRFAGVRLVGALP